MGMILFFVRRVNWIVERSTPGVWRMAGDPAQQEWGSKARQHIPGPVPVALMVISTQPGCWQHVHTNQLRRGGGVLAQQERLVFGLFSAKVPKLREDAVKGTTGV